MSPQMERPSPRPRRSSSFRRRSPPCPPPRPRPPRLFLSTASTGANDGQRLSETRSIAATREATGNRSRALPSRPRVPEERFDPQRPARAPAPAVGLNPSHALMPGTGPASLGRQPNPALDPCAFACRRPRSTCASRLAPLRRRRTKRASPPGGYQNAGPGPRSSAMAAVPAPTSRPRTYRHKKESLIGQRPTPYLGTTLMTRTQAIAGLRPPAQRRGPPQDGARGRLMHWANLPHSQLHRPPRRQEPNFPVTSTLLKCITIPKGAYKPRGRRQWPCTKSRPDPSSERADRNRPQ